VDLSEDEPAEAGEISATFRNGSVTVVGVLAAFSLGFLTAWAANPVPWGIKDSFALIPILAGVAFQMWSLAALLDYRSLQLPRYRRAITHFMIGLILVGVGVAVALAVDVVTLSEIRDVVEALD
jgi:hypothetical protein